MISGNNLDGIQIQGATTSGKLRSFKLHRDGSYGNRRPWQHNRRHPDCRRQHHDRRRRLGQRNFRKRLRWHPLGKRRRYDRTQQLRRHQCSRLSSSCKFSARHLPGRQCYQFGHRRIGAGEGNLVSGNNNDGIRVDGSTSDNNNILGNYIGTDVTGSFAIGNFGDGIYVTNGDGIVIQGIPRFPEMPGMESTCSARVSPMRRSPATSLA